MRNFFKKRRLLTALFGLLIAFNMCQTPGQAAKNDQQKVLRGDEVTAKVNEEVELPIYLTSSGEVAAGQVKFVYDEEALELTKISAGSDLTGFSIFHNLENGKAIFGNLSGKTIPTGTVEILIATFEIKAGAELKKYSIELQDVAFSSSEALEITDLFSITHGNITVQSNQSPGGGDSSDEDNDSTPVRTEEIEVDVDAEDGTNLTTIPITRTTDSDGQVKDHVFLSEENAKGIILKAQVQNVDTMQIVIPDNDDKVSEVVIEIPQTALQQINDGNMKLEIAMENVLISIPTTSISGFEEDLYFRVVPIKSEAMKKQVEERAKKDEIIQKIAKGQTVKIFGRPMEIETNMQNREVSIVLPLKDSLPTDPEKRQEILDNLGVFIEHSDGTKELLQGNLVTMRDGSEGIEFKVTKFSTFTLIYMDGWKEFQESQQKQNHLPYIFGYGDVFRPNANVTRAQIAAMISRNFGMENHGTGNSSYRDVDLTHWAFREIENVKNVGIMMGYTNGEFGPEETITRAQMAAIVYRAVENACELNTKAYRFCGGLASKDITEYSDVQSDHWAYKEIHIVRNFAIMEGYIEGNSFKPENKLTRAQAVKVLNRLFKRGPLLGVVKPTFTDVPTTHWAYAEIEEAAREHEYTVDENGKESFN